KAKINETKVAQIHSGMPTLIRVDAFPDRPLRGIVSEVTPIPAPNGAVSDVRIYFAVVRIEGGFDELRPGLSAEVDFHIETRRDVTRVPLQAIREVDGRSFAAVQIKTSNPSDSRPSWRWVPVKLGLSDDSHAEVLSGLQPGDQVIANPEALPAPPGKPSRTTVVRASLGPRE
ncbi:MAG: efflux RND transporter periplasmic adaptor subunit, partial [Solirubrobacterales bacterium]